MADFGIARALDVTAGRLTATGFSPGTPAYMSPEQAGGGGEVDARSDVYALGCILFEMVTGEAPFAGPTVQAVVAKHLGQPAPSARVTRATVPAALDACIARALAKDPADRFASAEDMARALRSSLAPGSERRRIGPALGATLGAVLIGVVAGGVFFLRPRAPAPDAPAGGTQAVRLAVLPFENQSPDAGDAYFAAGLTEEVTSSVGQLAG